ncbi:MAG TPA: AraC family transcriptional regulator, partial [Aestuariivirgaceae bacterium]|nr:AraC family transcriptional regulator [Aestuariivirgaceae bacterium]
RAVTSLSPLQFQKQLRLIEARRLMLSEGVSASSAAFAVGYESVPQFTREYGRLFGLPPVRDTEVAREQRARASLRRNRKFMRGRDLRPSAEFKPELEQNRTVGRISEA